MVVIDPGHGGKDTGAIGVNNIQEKDVVLNVAKEILKLNKIILDDAFDIYLTRYKDTLISLTDRTRLVKCLNADVFVSLHYNASKNYSKGSSIQ
ncbi:N-acetylmuramoyl-L-alanine amidase family protein [Thalassobellus citreus]|uniref:N-acetylmuramoyl-L-alanine amidase family protein n=1 Tax=Thalassobellus citreus TaxID=3367752 RepID=UPI0037A9D0F8